MRTAILALALLAAAAALFGCIAQGAPPQGRHWDGNGTRPQGFGNATDAERQAFEQAAADACAGKNEGDACETVGFNGTTRAGACRTMQSGLSCAGSRPQGTVNWNG